MSLPTPPDLRAAARTPSRNPAASEHLAVMALAIAGLAGAVVSGAGMLPVLVITSVALGWTLLRSAFEVVRSLVAEFGLHAARGCALPSGIIGALFLLVRVAHALRDTAREVDRVARMGGEEFCLLLPGVDEAGAERMVQRLLEVVRGLVHPEVDRALKVTVSIGVVVVGPAAEPLPVLLRRLDDALYAAKRQGRDRFERAPPAEAC